MIISACEKRAIKRTRSVVDSFALRIGPQTWITPITEEGLRELRGALKQIATRQTAVACYRNDGRKAMKLLWVVGSRRKFGVSGHFPAGHMTGIRRTRVLSPWVRVAALLTQTAGLSHDWGKAVRFFQTKLKETKWMPMKDPVRHEWISMKLLQAVRSDIPPETVWHSLSQNPVTRREKPEWFSGINKWEHALEYLISTHHKLFLEDGRNVLGPGNHVRDNTDIVRIVSAQDFLPHAPIPEQPLQKVTSNLSRLAKMPEAQSSDPYFWRAVATVSRVCLVLADHYVSSQPKATDDRDTNELYANTDQGKPSQSLSWHLREVGRVSGDLIYRLAELEMAGLSDEAVEKILKPSGDPRFCWQDTAVNAFSRTATERSLPTLVLNLADTGAGKTRMNAKAICALRPEEPVRFATALNLRTLTLQTGDAYRDELGIGRDELACVIGDRVIQKLHEYGNTVQETGCMSISGKGEPEDTDGNSIFDFELETLGESFDLPDWLEPLIAKRPGAASMLAPPVLVSTVDTLIKAGEPHYQGHHAIQFLRLASSDLILDELDGYDPDALVAVLRLVTLCGMFGRNVVASSATLPKPVARALVRAYQLGIRMYLALEGPEHNRFRCSYIDNLIDPIVYEYQADDEKLLQTVEQHFDLRIKEMYQALEGPRLKVPMLQEVEATGEEHLFEAAIAAVRQLHRNTCWEFNNKRISFGLIRCANIRTTIPMARQLVKSLPQARIASYHSQDFLIQRYHKEQRLDHLLNRKRGNTNIASDWQIHKILQNTEQTEVIFIVVATPVEEIGRDHDFDWAVIEPSSTHSIVQTAGRVNRHRLVAVSLPNIAILQFNALHLRGGDARGCVFVRPGLENADRKYPSHDLGQLLDWENLQAIDARLRYGDNHRLAVADNDALQTLLEHPSGPFSRFLRTTDALWAGVATYDEARLRNRREEQRFRVDETGEVFQEDRGNSRLNKVKWDRVDLEQDNIVDRAPNDWLTLSLGEMMDIADDATISKEQALSVNLPSLYRDRDGNITQQLIWDRSFGWMYR